MKAIVQYEYGAPDVLQFADIDKPVPKDDEVLIRVRAAGINAADRHFMRGTPYALRLAFGLRRPRNMVRGRDVAGEIESVGKDVTQLRPGDAVYAEVDTGSFAEYTCAPEKRVGLKPVNLTFEQAAAIPLAANTALQGLRDLGEIQPGQKVLINGASGGVGTFAVQLAKAFGAEVTAVCSTGKMDLVRSIGADRVIDYTREDFTREGRHYDLILDLATSRSLSACRRALAPNGTLVLIGGEGGRWLGPIGLIVNALAVSPFVGQKLRPLMAMPGKENLDALKELVEAGKVMPVIDQTFPLSETPAAIRYLEEGRARGKVVVVV